MSDAASPAMEAFFAKLFGAPTGDMPNIFDPWNTCSDDDVSPTAHLERRERLRQHFSAKTPRLLCVGEAPGYQGCRVSGCAFTSEALIMDGAIPRIPRADGRLTTRPIPWREPSATVVWGALYDHRIADDVCLWNAVPWHPYKEGERLSNRTPSREEKEFGAPILHSLVAALAGVKVVAIGNVAGGTLKDMGIDAPVIRHPSMGGANVFREGIAKLAAELR